MLNMLVETHISSARSSYSHPDSFLSKEAIQAWAGAQAQQNPGEEFPPFKQTLAFRMDLFSDPTAAAIEAAKTVL